MWNKCKQEQRRGLFIIETTCNTLSCGYLLCSNCIDNGLVIILTVRYGIKPFFYSIHLRISSIRVLTALCLPLTSENLKL